MYIYMNIIMFVSYVPVCMHAFAKIQIQDCLLSHSCYHCVNNNHSYCKDYHCVITNTGIARIACYHCACYHCNNKHS